MSKTKRSIVHGNQNYPWDVWEVGGPHHAKRGVHFRRRISLASFQGQLHVRASRIGRRVESSIDGNVVTFQFFDKE